MYFFKEAEPQDHHRSKSKAKKKLFCSSTSSPTVFFQLFLSSGLSDVFWPFYCVDLYLDICVFFVYFDEAKK